jgi:predicted dithiol-disulfide oxidoreductase (DUF899 family)
MRSWPPFVFARPRELPWVPVEKQYTFVTDDGSKSLPELFEGRSRLLIYHLMFGEDWTVACPGCSSLADGLGGVVTHLNDRGVTLICMSRAPLEKLVAYKQRRGWTVPYVSAHGDDFLFDYGYAFRREDMSGMVREEFDMGQLIREAPQWLRDYREDVGAPDLESAVSVSAGWSVFATRDDAVYNTYRVYPTRGSSPRCSPDCSSCCHEPFRRGRRPRVHPCSRASPPRQASSISAAQPRHRRHVLNRTQSLTARRCPSVSSSR